MNAALPATILGLMPMPATLLSPVKGTETQQESSMLTTITLAGQITAQGTRVAEHNDGRVNL